MKNKKYSNSIYENLSKNKKISLSILFEEDEKDDKSKNDDSEPSDSGSDSESDPFSALDNNSSDSDGDDSSISDENTEGSDETSNETTSDLDTDTDEKSLKFKELTDNISDLNNSIKRRNDIGSFISTVFNTNENRKISIKKFLNEETENAEKVIDDIQDILDKNDDLIKKVKSAKNDQMGGESFDIDLEVSKAIHRLIHFNEQYDIVDLVKDLYLMKIRLLAPVKEIKEISDEFEEKYQIAVHKNKHKIKDLPGSKHYNDESVYLDKPVKYNGAVGAKSQG